MESSPGFWFKGHSAAAAADSRAIRFPQANRQSSSTYDQRQRAVGGAAWEHLRDDQTDRVVLFSQTQNRLNTSETSLCYITSGLSPSPSIVVPPPFEVVRHYFGRVVLSSTSFLHLISILLWLYLQFISVSPASFLFIIHLPHEIHLHSPPVTLNSSSFPSSESVCVCVCLYWFVKPNIDPCSCLSASDITSNLAPFMLQLLYFPYLNRRISLPALLDVPSCILNSRSCFFFFF